MSGILGIGSILYTPAMQGLTLAASGTQAGSYCQPMLKDVNDLRANPDLTNYRKSTELPKVLDYWKAQERIEGAESTISRVQTYKIQGKAQVGIESIGIPFLFVTGVLAVVLIGGRARVDSPIKRKAMIGVGILGLVIAGGLGIHIIHHYIQKEIHAPLPAELCNPNSPKSDQS